MWSRFLPVFIAALVLLLHWTALADTVVLKSGEKIDGKVVKETDTEYTVEFKVSASITDVRTVLKSDVAKVEKEAPDEVAFQSIRNLKPGPTSFAPASYDGAMRALQGFLNTYPKSAHAAEIVPVLTAFAEEKTRVAAGDIKIDGKWIPKDEVQKERYQISARAIVGQMQEQARRNDLIGALNTFDQLEKNYPGATAYPDALVLAQQVLGKLKPVAEQALQTWQYQQKERDTATQLMSEPQRGEVIAAQKREQQQLDATLTAATKSGSTKWPALQRHEKTLTTIISKAQSELNRIDKLPTDKLRQSVQATEEARTALAKHDEETALASLKQATTLWAANELAVRLQKELVAQRAAAAKATPIPAATPVQVAGVATPRAAPKPAAPPGATPRPIPPPPPAEAPGFLSTPLGLGVVAVVLIGLLAGYFIYKKKKHSAEQQFE